MTPFTMDSFDLLAEPPWPSQITRTNDIVVLHSSTPDS